MRPIDKNAIFTIYISIVKYKSEYWRISIYEGEIVLSHTKHNNRMFMRKDSKWIIVKI